MHQKQDTILLTTTYYSQAAQIQKRRASKRGEATFFINKKLKLNCVIKQVTHSIEQEKNDGYFHGSDKKFKFEGNP
jgi:hypothetical protein